MALSPEERERIAEAERVRTKEQMKMSLGYAKWPLGCLLLMVLLVLGTCVMITGQITHR
jgi:cell division septal protein FtsQ